MLRGSLQSSPTLAGSRFDRTVKLNQETTMHGIAVPVERWVRPHFGGYGSVRV
jgi:hypothetical protein